MVRLVGVLSVVSLAIVVGSRSPSYRVPAENCGLLGYTGCNPDLMNDHKNPHTDGAGNYYEHSACEECYSALGAEGCHQASCGGSEFLAPEESAAYIEAQDAARGGDIEGLIRSGERAGGMVAYNTVRGTVQLISCDGAALLGNFAIPASVRSRAVRLPDVRTKLAEFAEVTAVSGAGTL